MPIQIDLGPSSKESQSKVQDSGPIIGIDLGTTHSLVASVLKDKGAQVLHAKDESPLLPSALYLNDQGKSLAVGYAALEKRLTHPKNVFFSFKRLMGRSKADLAQELNKIPFELLDDELKSQVKVKIGEHSLSPVELSAEILKTLKERAEKQLGTTVKRAVVTVPAYFDDAQRTATKAAGRLAGLEVIRVLNEPTAAALAYGWSHKNPGIVAVFDFGGGTFDISILRIEENVFEVLSTHGNTHLGGDDLDQSLATFLLTTAQEQKKCLESNKYWPEFLKEAELVKKRLSQETQSLFRVESFEYTLRREEAEAVWKPFVQKTLESCEHALKDARIQKEEIKDILMVGGSTRVPLVQKMAAEFFGKSPNTSLNPDEAVALGAALQAEILSGRGEERLLLDVLPLSLGIETMGGAVSKLIHRNSTLPTEAREIYTNHAEKQTAFDIHILQGERELVKDCRSLASFKLRGLAPAPAGYHRIEVLFRIDANGILNVRAKDLRSGKAHEVEVIPSYGITEDELLQMLEKSFDHAEEDIQKRQLVDIRVEADSVLKAGEKTLQNAGHLVSAQEIAQIKARLIDLKNVVNSSQSTDQIREAIENFDEVSRELAELQVNDALQKALAGQSTDKKI